MAVALWLVALIGLLIVVGAVLMIIGAFMTPPRRNLNVADPSSTKKLMNTFIDFLKESWKDLRNPRASRQKKLTALGAFFLLIGVTLLLAIGAVNLVTAAMGGLGGGTPDPTTTPSVTPSPTAS